MTMDIRTILWTGGMDSTFLVLQSAHDDHAVQPVYVAVSPTKSIRDAEVRRAVLGTMPERLASRIGKEIVVAPPEVYADIRNLRLGLIETWITVGGRDDQFPYNQVVAVAVARLLGSTVYVGTCSDDRCRGADWGESNAVMMPLRHVRKADMVREAAAKGWLPILATTHSCIMLGTEHCGSCVECLKRKNAGMTL